MTYKPEILKITTTLAIVIFSGNLMASDQETQNSQPRKSVFGSKTKKFSGPPKQLEEDSLLRQSYTFDEEGRPFLKLPDEQKKFSDGSAPEKHDQAVIYSISPNQDFEEEILSQ